MNQDDNSDNLKISSELIQQYSTSQPVIKYVKGYFNRLQKSYCIILIKKILNMDINISVDELSKSPKSFYHHNMGKFDKDKKMKLETIKHLRYGIIGYIKNLGKELDIYENKEPELKSEVVDGKEYYFVDEHSTHDKVRRFVCDEGGEVNFKYDFDKGALKSNVPKSNNLLQRCSIQILSRPVKFDYPVEYSYNCIQCKTISTKKAYEVVSSQNKNKCEAMYQYVNANGEPKSKVCGLMSSPDNESSISTPGYYYDISYDDELGDKQTVGAFSFNKYEPGFYDVVLFKLTNPNKAELFHIIDAKAEPGSTFVIPEKEKGINYLFTLQKAFDSYILEKTGMNIYGLYPVKVALILQYALSFISDNLNFNLQIVGDSSTGKSTVLKYYGFLLANNFNLSTNGLSISVAALRGTRQSITLMGKEQKIITVGYLGTFKTIHIDEAGENRDLVQNLKTFLLENNYSYDRAGATGVFNKRTAQINLSENIDTNHLGQYRGMIRKAYKEFDDQIGEEEHVKWDEDWDLHKPIFEYTNPYLRKIIKDKRTELEEQKKFWIDGYEIPLHERFPFYFYLVNDKENEELDMVVQGNYCRETIQEQLKLIKVLKSNNIKEFFNSLIKYKDAACDETSFVRVDRIISEYGNILDARQKAFFYMLLKLSRIINKRNEFNEEDYDLVRWFLENTNRKLDVSDTNNYKINGAPNIKRQKEVDMEIEDNIKSGDSKFGLPDNEF